MNVLSLPASGLLVSGLQVVNEIIPQMMQVERVVLKAGYACSRGTNTLDIDIQIILLKQAI